MDGSIQVNEAKDFCYQKFSARGKDKNKTSTSATSNAETKTTTNTSDNTAKTASLSKTTNVQAKSVPSIVSAQVKTASSSVNTAPSTHGSQAKTVLVSNKPLSVATKAKDDPCSSTSTIQPQKKETQLPPVRGSFQSFDVDKGKKPRVIVTPKIAHTVKPQNSEKAESLKTSDNDEHQEASVVPNPLLPIAATSWLNKAKDGGAKALASMFDKSKTSQ